ncbi:MAG TPA: L,D-transpeptidase family protein [Candidatus Paceibacterota bacterium]|nr:L,D-transpeptidase family protein [Candidatus Paceibacterota bacterium]
MDIIVKSAAKAVFNGKEYNCAIGKNGVTDDKKESDGMTPIGCFPLREVFYRPDRIAKPKTGLPISEINKGDGWCNDVNLAEYNQKIKLPFNGSYEELWHKEDNLYDVVVVMGYNDNPIISGKGSTIFLHIARPEFTPTLGCVAFRKEDLLEILKDCDINTRICIQR